MSSRREFMLSAGRGGLRTGLAAGVLYGTYSWFRREGKGPPVEDRGLLRPPGALGEASFLASCIRCDLCAQVCSTQCIRLFDVAAGRLAGTPYILARDRACNLCLECTLVCPSGALTPLSDRARVEMGTAKVDERLCVSLNGSGVCGACHTICPLRNKAITQGLFNAPTVNREHCVGCGLCEEACIVEDPGAIRVVSGRSWS
ncbi:MAG: 4Fe-4S dicluster domain-containing protein [Planctomycetota bacterium]